MNAGPESRGAAVSAAPSCGEGVFTTTPVFDGVFDVTPPLVQKVTFDVRFRWLSRIARLSPDLGQFARQRYGEIGLALLARLYQLSDRFSPLIIDPGLVLRFSEFEEFVRSRGLADRDPFEVREAFKESLGTKMLYRGVVLTDDEFAVVRKVGLASALLRNHAGAWSTSDLLGQTFPQLVTTRVIGDIKDRMLDPLISVTEVRDVAVGVGARYAETRPDAKLYIFTLKVSTLDLVFESSAPHAILPYPTNTAEYSMVIKSRSGQTSVQKFADPAVESFLLYDVLPEEIVSWEIVDPATAPDISFSKTGGALGISKAASGG